MKIVAPHRRSFERAPRVSAGDCVTRHHLDQNTPRWFYGEDARGIKGYFPVDWFDAKMAGGRVIAFRDYSAMELNVAPGDVVERIDECGDWLLVRKGAELGWIPGTCVEHSAAHAARTPGRPNADA